MVTNPDVCKELLEILLHRKINRIEIPEAEKSIDIDFESKGIRLDVYAQNEQEAFDLELQIIDTKELPQRAHYYQGLIDIDNLKAGMQYRNMKKSYVIFLCMKDVFEKGLPVYWFENLCSNDSSIRLNDGAYKIFFNSDLYDKMKTKEERDFFNFLKNGLAGSDFTEKINHLIESAKHNAQWRHKFMTWEMEMLCRESLAREEAYKEASQKKAETTAINLIKLNTLTFEQIATSVDLPLEKVKELGVRLLAESEHEKN